MRATATSICPGTATVRMVAIAIVVGMGDPSEMPYTQTQALRLLLESHVERAESAFSFDALNIATRSGGGYIPVFDDPIPETLEGVVENVRAIQTLPEPGGLVNVGVRPGEQSINEGNRQASEGCASQQKKDQHLIRILGASSLAT